MKFLDELERLEKAATPGPWAMESSKLGVLFVRSIHGKGSFIAEALRSGNHREVNAALIAALRNAAPALLAIARAAQLVCSHQGSIDWADVERLRSALAALENVGAGGPE